MTDPARLLDQGASNAELALLRAGDAEEPPEAGRQKLAALLGVSAALSASAAAGGAKAASASLPPLAAKLGVNWLAVAAAGAIASGGVFLYMKQRSTPPIVEATHVAPARAKAPAESQPKLEAPPFTEPAVAAPTDDAVGPAPSPRSAAEPSARAGAKSISEEIAELDAVRRALHAQAPNEALRLLDGYAQGHSGGVLAQEAVLLRIEALATSGNVSGARSLADRFLRDNPKTPHRRRILTLVGEAP